MAGPSAEEKEDEASPVGSKGHNQIAAEKETYAIDGSHGKEAAAGEQEEEKTKDAGSQRVGAWVDCHDFVLSFVFDVVEHCNLYSFDGVCQFIVHMPYGGIIYVVCNSSSWSLFSFLRLILNLASWRRVLYMCQI